MTSLQKHINDVLLHAAKAFVGVFLTAMPVASVIHLKMTDAKAALFAAGAAALSVVWSALEKWANAS